MHQVTGFQDPTRHHFYCIVDERASFGTKHLLINFVLAIGFTYRQHDNSLFIYCRNINVAHLLLYVYVIILQPHLTPCRH